MVCETEWAVLQEVAAMFVDVSGYDYEIDAVTNHECDEAKSEKQTNQQSCDCWLRVIHFFRKAIAIECECEANDCRVGREGELAKVNDLPVVMPHL